MDSLWVYENNLPLISSTVILVSSIIWLTSSKNRSLLTLILSNRIRMYPFDNFYKSLIVGLIAIFALICVGVEIAKILIKDSEGYEFVTKEILKDKTIEEKIGTVEFIALGNSYEGNTSFSTSKKTFNVNLRVFGVAGQLSVDVNAIKLDDWRISSLTINE